MEVKQCPIKMIADAIRSVTNVAYHNTDCTDKCAWYDHQTNECIIHSIAYDLNEEGYEEYD